jgi:hypothetical protein
VDQKNQKPDQSHIGELEKDLYSRDKPSILDEERHHLEKTEQDIGKGWQKEASKNTKKKHRNFTSGLFKKIFISAAIFFVLASSISLFIVFGGLNIISSQNIDLSIEGLTIIEGGEELVLDVLIQNNNRVALEDVSIVVEYPDGAREHQDINNVLIRQQEEIDFISAKGQASRTFRSILFGEQNSIKSIKVTIQLKALPLLFLRTEFTR